MPPETNTHIDCFHIVNERNSCSVFTEERSHHCGAGWEPRRCNTHSKGGRHAWGKHYQRLDREGFRHCWKKPAGAGFLRWKSHAMGYLASHFGPNHALLTLFRELCPHPEKMSVLSRAPDSCGRERTIVAIRSSPMKYPRCALLGKTTLA